MHPVQAHNHDGHMSGPQLVRYPDYCPHCHHGVQFSGPLYVYQRHHALLEAIFRCPRFDCQCLTIVEYNVNGSGYYDPGRMKPQTPKPPPFSGTVLEVSKDFAEIFSEAHAAEHAGLGHVAGVGYGKALEFLVKDYLLRGAKDEDQKAAIKKAKLGQCIANYVSNEPIKAVAKRASWLRNDETHYERRWTGKDVTDLKGLIQLTVSWIELEVRTDQALKEMPDGS